MNKNMTIICIYLGAFFIAFSYGVFFLLPLFVEQLGGNEKTVGFLLSIGGVGTLSAVLVSKYLLKKLKSKTILMLGSLSYCLGSLGFFIVHQLGGILTLSVILNGIGWGLYFNASPYALSLLSTQNNRSTLFSYLSAFCVLGTGVSPILIKYLWGTHIEFNNLFLLSFLSSLLAGFSFCFMKVDSIPTEVGIHSLSLGQSIRLMMVSSVKYPIIMVFFGACILTMMINFQTTYAKSLGMNYAYFYAAYSLAVVVSRFLLGHYLSNFNQYKLSISLLSLMFFSLILFLFVPSHQIIYVISSILFGISYGLAYPIIQAICMNLTKPNFRSDMISYFSISYFIGIYTFPPLGGLLIVHFGYQFLLLCMAFLASIELFFSIILYRSLGYKIKDNVCKVLINE